MLRGKVTLSQSKPNTLISSSIFLDFCFVGVFFCLFFFLFPLFQILETALFIPLLGQADALNPSSFLLCWCFVASCKVIFNKYLFSIYIFLQLNNHFRNQYFLKDKVLFWPGICKLNTSLQQHKCSCMFWERLQELRFFFNVAWQSMANIKLLLFENTDWSISKH